MYKNIGLEAQATAVLVKAIHDGSNINALTKGATVKTSDGTANTSELETPVTVDKTNFKDTVIKDGFVTTQQVCQGLPKGAGGIC